jgi:hypothetical protein
MAPGFAVVAGRLAEVAEPFARAGLLLEAGDLVSDAERRLVTVTKVMRGKAAADLPTTSVKVRGSPGAYVAFVIQLVTRPRPESSALAV